MTQLYRIKLYCKPLVMIMISPSELTLMCALINLHDMIV